VQLPGLSQGQEKEFCHFKRYYLAIYKAEISEFFSTSFQTSTLQDHMITCVKKKFENLVLVLEMVVFERFW